MRAANAGSIPSGVCSAGGSSHRGERRTMLHREQEVGIRIFMKPPESRGFVGGNLPSQTVPECDMHFVVCKGVAELANSRRRTSQ